MIKQYTTLILDMYGVILEQCKGVKGYILENTSPSERERINDILENTDIVIRADLGRISSEEFFASLGFGDAEKHLKRYVEEYLTLDSGFIPFVESIKDKYDFVLLSNDVSAWSRYITRHFGLDKYFKDKIISGDLGFGKPDFKIFDYALEKLGKRPAECIFVDDRGQNLLAAEEVGISPILFNRGNGHYYGASVNSFAELYSFIG